MLADMLRSHVLFSVLQSKRYEEWRQHFHINNMVAGYELIWNLCYCHGFGR